MSDANLDRVVSILAARDDEVRPQLDRIGRAIGYGNACHILGELWDDMLEAEGFQRGRGSMERRPERQAAEKWKSERDDLLKALLTFEPEFRERENFIEYQDTARTDKQLETLRRIQRALAVIAKVTGSAG